MYAFTPKTEKEYNFNRKTNTAAKWTEKKG